MSGKSQEEISVHRRRVSVLRKTEIERAIKGVISSGLTITRVEIEGGKVVVCTGADGPSPLADPLTAWRRENG